MKITNTSLNSIDIVRSSERDSPDFQNNTKIDENVIKKDSYKKVIPEDVTYSNLVKNSTRGDISDNVVQKADVGQSKQNINSGTQTLIAKKQTISSRKNNISTNATGASYQKKEVFKVGDAGVQVVDEIVKQVQKNVEKLNKYNLSKGNRLTKTIKTDNTEKLTS